MTHEAYFSLVTLVTYYCSLINIWELKTGHERKYLHLTGATNRFQIIEE